MTKQVHIKRGFFRKQLITDVVAPLYQGLKKNQTGMHISVIGSVAIGLGDHICRIKVESEDDFVITGNDDIVNEQKAMTIDEFLSSESDEDAMDRIEHSFEMLESMASAAADGVVRGLIVYGTAGIGKSFGVEKVLSQYNTRYKLERGLGEAENIDMFEVIKGAATPIALYKKLYEYRHEGNVVVLDDCDSVLFDDVSLNLLKAALDTSKKRHLSWLSESRALTNDDIPDRFEFEGSIVFLTNIDFEFYRGRVAEHLKALMSRVHYFDLEIRSIRDTMLRIKQVVRAGMLKSYGLSHEEQTEIVDFIDNNRNYLRELSLRTVLKVADWYASSPHNWVELSVASTFTRDAKYHRLMKQKCNAMIIPEVQDNEQLTINHEVENA